MGGVPKSFVSVSHLTDFLLQCSCSWESFLDNVSPKMCSLGLLDLSESRFNASVFILVSEVYHKRSVPVTHVTALITCGLMSVGPVLKHIHPHPPLISTESAHITGDSLLRNLRK